MGVESVGIAHLFSHRLTAATTNILDLTLHGGTSSRGSPLVTHRHLSMSSVESFQSLELCLDGRLGSLVLAGEKLKNLPVAGFEV